MMRLPGQAVQPGIEPRARDLEARAMTIKRASVNCKVGTKVLGALKES